MSRIKLTLLLIFIYSNIYSLCHAKLSTGFNRKKKTPKWIRILSLASSTISDAVSSSIKRWAGIFNQSSIGIDFQYFI
uniref:Putative secreted peptide n=1 Tax=Anopheles braziliensis TaxID=58242 RepID=A0A2M3ZRT8_9DIPT